MLDLSTGPGIFEMASWELQNRVSWLPNTSALWYHGWLRIVTSGCASILFGFSFMFVAPGDRKCTRTELQDLLYHFEEGQLRCLTGLIMPLKALRVHQAGNTVQLHK